MNDPVWFGNHIIARWEAFAILIGGGAAAIVTSVIATGLVCALIRWLVSAMAKPGKQ